MYQQFSQTNLALGSDVTLNLVYDEKQHDGADLFKKLWKTIYEFEKRFSRFIPMSELSIFNRSACVKQFISPEFKDILLVAKKFGEETDGMYNPFLLPAIQRSGYTRSFAPGYEDDLHDDFSDRQVVTIDRLEIGGDWATIPYGTALDLGGCGKGYLADNLADNFVPKWIHGYWFSIGGDVAGAGFDEQNESWRVLIENGEPKKDDLHWIMKTTGERFGIATSATNIRKGTKAGKKWHHIIDPRTLEPAVSNIKMATLLCDTTVRADVLASCAIIYGTQTLTSFLRTHGVKAALLQGNANKKDFIKKFGLHINQITHAKKGAHRA